MRYGIAALGMFFILMSAALPAPVCADEKEEKKQYLYQWTDGKGNMHIVNDMGSVPEQYRSGARRLETPKERTGDDTRRDSPTQRGRYAPAPSSGVNDAAGRAQWQKKLGTAKQRLARAEARYRSLEEEKNTLLRAWGSPALAPVASRMRSEEIDKELVKAQKEIDEARNMIDVVIPEQARKAGVPPGWLRE
ncbi:MAG TPA: hypothetical protein DCO77_08835 [Nitrospiraceae bacterium]|nr:hypothetical protein [Nitrospiraceae bacterium]